MSNTEEKNSRKAVSFMAIDRYIEKNIIDPTETKPSGREWWQWGDGNAYPDYLFDLYRNVTTLGAVIDGTVDYIGGNDARLTNGKIAVNLAGDTVTDMVRWIARDWLNFGGFALEIIATRDLSGIAEIHWVDMRHIRTNKDNSVFWLCEDFGKRYVRPEKITELPKFMPGTVQPHSVLYVKEAHTQVYPSPRFRGAVKACEIEKAIDSFHLNSINNAFTGSYIVNFNNGQTPTPEIQEEIENDFVEKFSGHQNAGQIGFSWNESRVTATTVEKIDVEDFGAKYNSLAQWSRQQIFTAFRANPNLFGIATENLGFSQEEYDSAFKLYNRTQVKPAQKAIADAFEKIYGIGGVLNIEPFSLEGTTEQKVQ